MTDASLFMDKEKIPTSSDVEKGVGASIHFWNQIRDYVLEIYPTGKEEWNFPGKKYGWSFRIKDKKRAILYFLPRENYFKVAFRFWPKSIRLYHGSFGE